MKFITLAAVMLLCLFAAQNVSAQCAYDAITPAVAASAYTGAGFSPAADRINIATPPNPNPTSFNKLDVVYICTVAGAYTVTWEERNNYVFRNAINGPVAGAPFLVGVGNFNLTPGVWQLSWIRPNCVAVGAPEQTFTFYQPTPGLYIAYTNAAAIPAGTSIPGISLDAGVANGILRPDFAANGGEDEWYEDGNLMFSLCGCPAVVVPPVDTDLLTQPFVTTAKKLSDNLPVNLVKDLRTRHNKSL